MAKQDENQDGLRKKGTSRRSRAGRAGKGGTMPRIMVLGVLVIVAAGAALFWPRGGNVPTGIGEHQTIVSTLPDSQTVTAPPRSGEVDINSEAARLTPEKAETEVGQQALPAAEEAAPPPAEPEQKKEEPKPQPVKKTQPTQPRIEPRSDGPWAVQVGAFGQAENADSEAARLKAKGWDARVRAGNNSSGNMVFRVWIGYFDTRERAQGFINQNSRHLAGAIPVHR